MMRRYPCLFECRDGSLYLVLEDPSSASLADISGDIRSIVVRLDGEPTTWADTSQVFHTLTMETLDRMLSAFQCLSVPFRITK